MTIRATAIAFLLHLASQSSPLAAQAFEASPFDGRLVPPASGMLGAAVTPARPLLSYGPAELARRPDPLSYGLVGALVGGLAMAGFLAYSCSRMDCILDPTVPIAMGIGGGFLVGFAVGGGIRVQP